MNKKEAKAQIIWGQYLRQTDPPWYGYFELKYCDKPVFSLDKIESSQLLGLPALEKKGFMWKLSDADIRQKPCDCIYTPPLPAYFVLKFHDGFYAIRQDKVIEKKRNGETKLTRNEALIIAEKVIHIEGIDSDI